MLGFKIKTKLKFGFKLNFNFVIILKPNIDHVMVVLN